MTQLTGKNRVGDQWLDSTERYRIQNVTTGVSMETDFAVASDEMVAQAAQCAQEAFQPYSSLSHSERAHFLKEIANQLDAITTDVVAIAMQETGLPSARLTGEMGRTTGQLRLFAQLLENGDWQEAVIDQADPERTPLPKPDTRRILRPLGPVAVFGASNFPLAFSVAGGDTASALAAGCPVLVKVHPAHPGTSELVAQAVVRAMEACQLPSGVFSLLHSGPGHRVGEALVTHPVVKAVGFTGSIKGGRALFNLASQRPEPIPFYGELGSVNPVFVTDDALSGKQEAFAQAYLNSLSMGCGQICTNPGLMIVRKGKVSDAFLSSLAEKISALPAGLMLHRGMADHYRTSAQHMLTIPGVSLLAQGQAGAEGEGQLQVAVTSATNWFSHPELTEEVFGPFGLIIECDDDQQMLQVASQLQGQLTSTIHGMPEKPLIQTLAQQLQGKVGRLLFNGFPTGVEVNQSMHHGGPYPASTDARSTSVGAEAIKRFVRPVCYQNMPDVLLPEDLRRNNPNGILRKLNGDYSRQPG